MPQITCPNCGTTINLENRRALDFKLIRSATDKTPRTFTELLHITKLSRKTLNLRLKELCAEGILLKNDGMYSSNGASEFGNNGGNIMNNLSRVFSNKKMTTGLMLVAVLACFSASGYVMAMMIAPTTYVQPELKPAALGTFTVALNITNVSDLYSWQAAISFNPNQMSLQVTRPGNFMSVDFPYFVASMPSDDFLLLGATLKGNAAGVSGSGTLATIVFEYYVAGYTPPSIVNEKAGFSTFLEDSSLSTIPGGQTLLTLNVVG